MKVVPVNARVPVPDAAGESLRRLYGSVQEAQAQFEFALTLVCQTLGVDREKLVAYDGDAGELVLEEADKERMPA